MNAPSLPPGSKWNQNLQVVLTLVIGGAGARAATVAGLPAAALIGSAMAVSVRSFGRRPTFIPTRPRKMAFAAIGCSLDSGMPDNLLDPAFKWPLSLCGHVLVMGAVRHQIHLWHLLLPALLEIFRCTEAKVPV